MYRKEGNNLLKTQGNYKIFKKFLVKWEHLDKIIWQSKIIELNLVEVH